MLACVPYTRKSLALGVMQTETMKFKVAHKIQEIPTQYCGILIELPYRNLLSIVSAIEEFACT